VEGGELPVAPAQCRIWARNFPISRVPQTSAHLLVPQGKRRSADGCVSKDATNRQHCITWLQGMRRRPATFSRFLPARRRWTGRVARGGNPPWERQVAPRFCPRPTVDTQGPWGKIEKIRDFHRFGVFQHPPNRARRRRNRVPFSQLAGCGRLCARGQMGAEPNARGPVRASVARTAAFRAHGKGGGATRMIAPSLHFSRKRRAAPFCARAVSKRKRPNLRGSRGTGLARILSPSGTGCVVVPVMEERAV
jgi:hypothetical protein